MKKIYSFLIASLFSVSLFAAAPATGLQFNATSNASIITLDPNAAFSPAQFTIEVWVNYIALNGGGYIIATEGYNPSNHGFSLRLNGTSLDFAIGDGTTNWQQITNPAAIIANTWFHVAATYSGTELKMYIDGLEVATKTVALPMVASTEKITFGDSPAWSGRLFKGQMADFRFYDVVRTPAEINADMTSTVTATTTGLVAGWKMNEGTGTTVADVKGLYNLTKPAEITWFGAVAGVNTVFNNSKNIETAVYGRTLEVSNKTKGNLQLSVYSLTGQKVMEDLVGAGAKIQKQLTAMKGAYILKCVAVDGSSYTKKFIIAE